MIKSVADQVVGLGVGHTVDLDNPERTILVELYKVTPTPASSEEADVDRIRLV